MDYQEALAYITDLQNQKGSSYSLEAVQSLCRLAGRPDRSLSVVHIAGTNGKGSVGTYLGNILAQSGYCVGRYISPAVFGYRERIQRLYSPELSQGHTDAGLTRGRGDADAGVSTEYISEPEVAEFLTRLRSLTEEMSARGEETPTAFEIETVMAFMAMQRWQVDVALIECGLGGGRDATNIIDAPRLCLFSRIGLDHTAYLGESIEEITKEKCGILKEGSNAVSVKQDRLAEGILRDRCEKLALPLVIANVSEAEEVHCEIGNTSFSYHGTVFEMGQSGIYQIENAVAAIEAANVLKQQGYAGISEIAVQKALQESRWKGRFECVSENPYTLVDGAHNPLAAMELRKSLELYFPGEKFTYVCGMFRDKDYLQILRIMLPLAERVYTLPANGARSLSAEELADAVRMAGRSGNSTAVGQSKYGDDLPVQACASAGEALELAAQKREKILVFGSLSFMQEVYQYFACKSKT